MHLHKLAKLLMITIGLGPTYDCNASSSPLSADEIDDIKSKIARQPEPIDTFEVGQQKAKPLKKTSPLRAMVKAYKKGVQEVTSKYSDLSTRLQAITSNEDTKSITGFDAHEQLTKLSQRFADFVQLDSSDEPLGNKRSALLDLNKACKSLEREIADTEKMIKKLIVNGERKKLTASAEQLLRNQQFASKNDNCTHEVKVLAKKILQDQKNATHNKLTRPGAQGPNARDHNEQRTAHQENKTKIRPYQHVEFEKSVKGTVPPAAMKTVVLIRNIIRKSKNKEQILAELNKFEKDINLKEVNPNYVGLSSNDVDTVYQIRINGQYRAIVAFKKGIYTAPDGRNVTVDLLYKNTFWVCDPHK